MLLSQQHASPSVCACRASEVSEITRLVDQQEVTYIMILLPLTPSPPLPAPLPGRPYLGGTTELSEEHWRVEEAPPSWPGIN